MTNIRQDKLMNLAKESLSEHRESQESEGLYRPLTVRILDPILIVHSYRRPEDRR